MARIKLTKTTEDQLKKIAESEHYKSLEEYLVDVIIKHTVDKLTVKDILVTKQQIETLQKNLNDKRQQLL